MTGNQTETKVQTPVEPSPAATLSLAQEIAELITQVRRVSLVQLSTQVSEGNISIPQYTLLSFLNQTGGITMSRLAELMQHTSPATTGLVDRLVSSGFVERYGNPTDRRQVLVKITDKGRELVEKIKSKIVAFVINQTTAIGASSLAIIAGPTDLITSPGAAALVPEPTTLGLLGIGILGLIRRRPRRHAR